MKTSPVKKFANWFKAHKIKGGLLVLVILLAGYGVVRAASGTSNETKYFLESAEIDTIVSTVSGSGQVSASNQVDLKSKVSGNITSLNVMSGQDVSAGSLIASIDARDALIALENQRIALAKLTKTDQVSLLQSQNSLLEAQQSSKEAYDSLAKSYDSGFNSVSNAFLDIPSIDIGLNDLINDQSSYIRENKLIYLSDTAKDLRNKASASYWAAKRSYDSTFNTYKGLTRASASSSVEQLILNTYDTAKLMATAVKDAKNVVDQVRGEQPNFEKSLADTASANISSWTSKTNSALVDLLGVKTSIENAKTTIDSTSRTIGQRKESLTKVEQGADPLDVQSAQLALTQKQYAYEDYFIRAPFDGTIAKVSVKKTDTASSGTVIATLISKQRMAEITLNEVDIAKVKVGQKVTLTFDAVPDLTLTGTVSEVDLVGTVTQGVVTYAVKIAFDADDARVKPGMSASASVITEVKPDVLTVSNSAIKSQGNSYYVETLPAKYSAAEMAAGVTSAASPIQKPVTIGNSNDTITEITSGLSEGDQVVVRTTTAAAQTTARSTTPNLFQATGAQRTTGGGGGNNVRFTR